MRGSGSCVWIELRWYSLIRQTVTTVESLGRYVHYVLSNRCLINYDHPEKRTDIETYCYRRVEKQVAIGTTQQRQMWPRKPRGTRSARYIAQPGGKYRNIPRGGRSNLSERCMVSGRIGNVRRLRHSQWACIQYHMFLSSYSLKSRFAELEEVRSVPRKVL